MADKLDPTEEKLSLSMPSLRRRRRTRAAEPAETTTDTAEPVPADERPATSAATEPLVADPPRDSGAEDTAVLPEVSEAPAARETTESAPTPPAADPVVPEAADNTADNTAGPDGTETHGTVGSSAGLVSGPIPGAPSPPVSAARPHPDDDVPAHDPGPEPVTEPGTHREDDSTPWRQRVDLIPMLPGRIAALVTGAIVGLAGTALTYAGLQGCSSVRGASTCGAPGFILLFAILVILVLLGSVLLSVWQIEGAGSASVLGVGLTAVVVILFFTSVVFSPWMFLVVPVVGALAYLGSWWVTTNFAEEPLDPWAS